VISVEPKAEGSNRFSSYPLRVSEGEHTPHPQRDDAEHNGNQGSDSGRTNDA
jgi:hypothetical protein